MSNTNIMIHAVDLEYTTKYIANIFWRNKIAKVDSITVMPQILNNKITNKVYIKIGEYLKSEDARKFKENINKNHYIFPHNPDENVWIIEKNTHNSGNICAGSFTTVFDDSFFRPFDDISDYNEDE